MRDKHKIYPNEVYKYANLKKEDIDTEFLSKVHKAIAELKESIVNFSKDESTDSYQIAIDIEDRSFKERVEEFRIINKEEIGITESKVKLSKIGIGKWE